MKRKNIFVFLILHLTVYLPAQESGCIGFGNSPSGCGTDCETNIQVCEGFYPEIKDCQPGHCDVGVLSYCWYVKRPKENMFSLIPGVTSASYTPDASIMNAGLGLYMLRRCIACDQICLPDIYTEDTIEIISSPVMVTVELTPDVICQGDSATIAALPKGGVEPYTYLWSNGQVLEAFKDAPQSPGKNYSTIITDAVGCKAAGDDSLIVFSPSVGGDLTASFESLCQGGLVEFTLANQLGQVVQWEKRHDLGNWMEISHLEDNYSEVLDTTGLWIYRVLVQNGVCNAVYSNMDSCLVKARPVQPEILRVPKDITVCEGAILSVEKKDDGQGGVGTCWVEYRRSNDDGKTWTSWSQEVEDVTYAAIPGITRIETRRMCTGEGCISDPASEEWVVRPDPSIEAQPIQPLPICHEGQMEPLGLMAIGGTPYLDFQWEFESSPGIWDAVSDGLPIGAIYENANSAQDFSVSGISKEDIYAYRCRVSASGLGCEGALSDEVFLEVRKRPDPSFADPDGIRKVGAEWKFILENLPPPAVEGAILTYNEEILVDSFPFSVSSDTITFTIPEEAESETNDTTTRFCLQLNYSDHPLCPERACTSHYNIDPPKGPTTQLVLNTHEEVLCPSSPLIITLKADADPTTACGPNDIDSSFIQIFQGGQMIASWEYKENNVSTLTRVIDTLMTTGKYLVKGCVLQSNCTSCDSLNVYTLPGTLPGGPRIEAELEGAGGRDLSPFDLNFCPRYTYIVRGSSTDTIEEKVIEGKEADFLFGQNNLGFYKFTTGGTAGIQQLAVRYTVTGGCEYKDTISLVFRQDYDLAGDQAVCYGDTLFSSIPSSFQNIQWKDLSSNTILSNTSDLSYFPPDQGSTYTLPISLESTLDGCRYLDTFDLQVVKIAGKLEPWPDNACERRLFHLQVAEGTSVSGYTHPPTLEVDRISDFLWQVQSAVQGGPLTIFLAGPLGQCRDTLEYMIDPGGSTPLPVDSLFYDQCAATLLVPSGCPSGLGSWYRVSKTTGLMETLGSQAPSYLRNVLEQDTMGYTYIFLCQDPCDQVAVTRSADPETDPDDCGESIQSGFGLWPNPVHDLLQIRFFGLWKDEKRLEVRDVTGRLWYSGLHFLPQGIGEEIEMDSLPVGIYFLGIRDVSGQSAVSSFLKM